MQYSSCNPTLVSNHLPLPSAEAPAGYPCKNSHYRKNRKRDGDDGKREKAHSAPRALFFFFPSFPTTQIGLYGGERPPPIKPPPKMFCSWYGI